MRFVNERRILTTVFVLAVVAATIHTAAAQTLTTIRNNGPSANRVDIVVLGDGYTQGELPKYANDVENFIQGFFGGDVFSEYQNYFNVHRLDVVSNESGADHPSRNPAVFKDTALDGTYDCGGVQRATCANLSKVNAILSGIQPDMRDLVLVILNDPEYGGTGGAVAVVSTHPDVVEVMLHEMGHTLGLLADEYGGPPPPACNSSVEPPEVNVTRAANGSIKWSTWIQGGTPLPTPGPTVGLPGLYQGAKYCDTGLYRPTYNSKMRSLYQPFEQINTEQLIKRIYNLVSPIDGANPSESNISLSVGQSQVLRVTTPQPLTHQLAFRWRIDNSNVSSDATLTLNAVSPFCASTSCRTLGVGTHLVQLVVSDPTPLVRLGELFPFLENHAWTVTVVAPDGRTLPTAAFVTADATTQGSWQGIYGRDSAAVIQDTIAYPSYAQVSVRGSVYTWDGDSSDPRALQRSSGSGRVAGTWYGDVPVPLIIDVNLTDGQPHRLALYCVDFDFLGRSQRIDVRDVITGAVLDSQMLTDFTGGRYMVWQLTGRVTIQVSPVGGMNAVVSGLFFDSPESNHGSASATATFVKADATTEGSWKGVYGQDSAAINFSDTLVYPSYGQVSVTGSSYAWEADSTDPRALQRGFAPGRLATTWYGDVVAIDVSLTDGQPHRLALYCVDFDFLGRSQRIDVRDAVTGALLDSQTLTDFTGGRYLVWQLTGHVTVQVTRVGGMNAVVSGVFFDPPPSSSGSGSAAATFVKADTTTQGSWKGVYGQDSAAIVLSDTLAYPSYAQVAVIGSQYAWEADSTDPRALQRGFAPSRLATTWYGDAVTVDVSLTDGKPHRMAIYCLDFDFLGRSERIDVRDAVSGVILDSQMVTDFTGGRYLVWQITGHVSVQVTRVGGMNAVVSGVFFDPAP